MILGMIESGKSDMRKRRLTVGAMLEFAQFSALCIKHWGDLLSRLERFSDKEEVPGSIPGSPTKNSDNKI